MLDLKKFAILILISSGFLTACATNKDRVEKAAAIEAEAGQVERGIDIVSKARQDIPPALPDDCAKQERSGSLRSDKSDIALLKADQAIGRGNARIERCYALSQQNRAAAIAANNFNQKKARQ